MIGAPLRRSVFAVPKMDCPSEERLIRMALDGLPGGARLEFDLGARRLVALHRAEPAALLERLQPLGLGATLVGSSVDAAAELGPHVPAGGDAADDAAEARTLRVLLAINGVMFVVELAIGLWAQSTGLVADAMDMFADAAVYGVALVAVGRSAAMKLRAARLAGWLQLALALLALVEVARRFVGGSEPVSALMIGVGALALVANVACLVLVTRQRGRGVHMKASQIFSANDVIANLGVVAAGLLVAWTGSRWPDLVIGSVIGVVVLLGAQRILRLR